MSFTAGPPLEPFAFESSFRPLLERAVGTLVELRDTQIPAKCEHGCNLNDRVSYAAGGECSNNEEGFRVNERRRTACVPKRNRITSVAAIVAPQTCDLVRGAFVLEHARVPLTHLVFFAVFDLLPCPSRKCSSLYCLTFAN